MKITLDEALATIKYYGELDDRQGRGSITMSVGDANRIIQLAIGRERANRTLPVFSKPSHVRTDHQAARRV